jgi:hypothetical protein
MPRGLSVRARVSVLALLGVPLVAWYLSWLLDPDRVGQPVLYALLLMAEALNVTQALGFWWTCFHERVRELVPPNIETQHREFLKERLLSRGEVTLIDKSDSFIFGFTKLDVLSTFESAGFVGAAASAGSATWPSRTVSASPPAT